MAAPVLAKTNRSIRRIQIERRDIFADGDSLLWYERLANRLHVLTKAGVIRRELTFREGEVLHPWFLEESERNLRQLGFLGTVKITADTLNDSGCTVRVRTQDQWSTELAASAQGGGGAYVLRLSGSEKNLFGWGKTIEAAYEKTDLRNQWNASVLDPRLFGSRLSAELAYEKTSEGKAVAGRLALPLFSIRSRYGFSLALSRQTDILRFFDKGEEAIFYNFRMINFSFRAVRSFGDSLKFDPFFLTEYAERDFSGPFRFAGFAGDPASVVANYVFPEPKATRLGLGLQVHRSRFMEGRFYDNFGNVEDIGLGPSGEISFAGSHQRLNSTRTRWSPALLLNHTRSFGSAHLVRLTFSVENDFLSDRWEGARTSARFIHYWRWGTRQTLAWQIRYVAITGVNRVGQLLLGGDNGLRGYDARRFSGNKRLLVNFEQRLFAPVEILTVGLGAVAFVDFGSAWSPGTAPALSSLRSDAGVGLRLGLLKSYGFKVLRLDWAKALNEPGSSFSFGTGMTFGLNL